MTIPVTESERASGSPEGVDARCDWTRLDPGAKRDRLLLAATEVFVRDGLDAPMSDVAAAAGAGVASVYRLFPSKQEVVAALVTRRMNEVSEAAQAARARTTDRWTALTGLLSALVQTQRADYLWGEAQVLVAEHPDVIESGGRATEAVERLLAEARAEGRLRADASTVDLRLLLAATRAARIVEPEHWPRILELLIDALDAHRGPPVTGRPSRPPGRPAELP
jgi:AcrR family transcriptional regulator